jgi:hypothetical protein
MKSRCLVSCFNSMLRAQDTVTIKLCFKGLHQLFFFLLLLSLGLLILLFLLSHLASVICLLLLIVLGQLLPIFTKVSLHFSIVPFLLQRSDLNVLLALLWRQLLPFYRGGLGYLRHSSKIILLSYCGFILMKEN